MKKNKKKVKIDVILLYFRRRRIRDALMKRWWEIGRASCRERV